MSLPIRRLIGLAERCVFGKQSVDSIHCGPACLREQVPSHTGHPFFRSYGAILPSSFCKTHSSTLGSSPHLPVSVYGTGTNNAHYEAFLGSMIRISWRDQVPFPCRLSVWISWICLGDHVPTGFDRHYRRPADRSLLRHPFVSLSHCQWYRNVDLFSIGYAFRPHLRVRLTLSGLTFLRKPWVFGGRVSRPSSRYSFRHNHFCVVDPTLSVELLPTAERSPTRRLSSNPKLRWWTLVPHIIGAGSLDQ